MYRMSTKASNPRCKINFGNLTFRILILQTTWFWRVFCMILGLNPDSVLGSLSSNPPGLQRICMILGLNLDSVFGSWSFKKKDKTNVYKCLQKPLIHDAKLMLEILLFGSWSSKLPGLECFAWFWDQVHIQFWDPYPSNHLVYREFAWFCD